MHTLKGRCDKCGGRGDSVPTYTNFGLRKYLRTKPLRDLEISVFVSVYILKMGWGFNVAGLGERRVPAGF
jgi:hypothetical protein